MHLERNINDQHRYLENVNIGKDLGVVAGNEEGKNSHCEESNCSPRVYRVKKDLSYVKKGGSDERSIMQSG